MDAQIHDTPRDPWTTACTAAALVSLAAIAGHVAGPASIGVAMPYAGGAGVVLGLGATVASRIATRDARLATMVAVLGLLVLRLLSVLWPGLIRVSHGAPSLVDGVALGVLVAAAALLLAAAVRTPPQPVRAVVP